MASPIANAATGSGLADSIFTFTFTATSGDAWGGWFVADSAAYAAGFTLATAFGLYSVSAETETGSDLSAQGLEDGAVFIEWYRDAGGAFLPTRNGPGTPSGTAGLGTEADASWTGTAWDSFGAGGADQADLVTLPADSLFTWRFTARSGDRWTGTLFEMGSAYAVGDVVETAAGTYRILAERTLAAGEEAAPRGTVRLTGGYLDAGSNATLAVQDAGQPVDAGTGGLGSETGAAWDGEGWVPFGAGGTLQVDADRDSSYYWTFWHPFTGDGYGGWLIEDSGRYAVGQVIPFNGGEYRIWSEREIGGHSGFANGTIWMTYYYDAPTGIWLTPQTFANGGNALATRGLGLEEDLVWEGDGLDWFGRGETWWVTVEQDSIYRWSVWNPETNDSYYGRLIADARAYAPGDVVTVNGVRYRIDGEQVIDGRHAEPAGTVWIDGYWDGRTGWWLWPSSLETGAPVTRGGLGTEESFVWDGDGWDWFGRGQTWWVDVEGDSLYRWSFWSPATNDAYAGRLIADQAAYRPGDVIRTALGLYRIEAEQELGRRADQPTGTIWVDVYYDGVVGWLFNESRDTGAPAGRGGLGSEADRAWDGNNWDWFGGGDTRGVIVE
jgi:hypothetical protein